MGVFCPSMISDEHNKDLGRDWVPITAITQGKRKICSRSTLYRLINAKAIKSVAMRTPGHVKGRRLVYVPSLENYLNRLADGGEMASGPPNDVFCETATISLNTGSAQSSCNEGFKGVVAEGAFLVHPRPLLTLWDKEDKTTREEKGQEGSQ